MTTSHIILTDAESEAIKALGQQNTFWKTTLWNQFGAAIDMLENAIRACPEELWRGQMWPIDDIEPRFSEVWCIAAHVLFWLDFYLTNSPDDFAPPPPFGLEELDPAGVVPPRAFTKDEILAYLAYGRAKCKTTIENLTEARAQSICEFGWVKLPFGEMLLYNMRHVQEHTAQINLFIGQHKLYNPRWVKQAG